MARSLTQQLASRKKEAQALVLRQEGHSYEEIAHRVGYANRGAAYKAVQRALLDVIRGPVEELRLLQMERLEEIFRILWPVAIDPTNPKHVQAIEKLLSVMERMDRLSGLSTPVKAASRGAAGLPAGAVLVIGPVQ